MLILNAIIIDGHPIGKSVLQGEGAGPGPTSSALISDLCSILRGNIKFPFGVSVLFVLVLRRKQNLFQQLFEKSETEKHYLYLFC